MRPPRFSIIIVTCNRRRTLALCLKHLARQSLPASDLEVLVVDDGSTDGTRDWLVQARFPFALRALETGNPADVFGVMRGRNIALLHARGDWVLFLDDDMVLHPEALGRLAREHEAWRSRGQSAAARGWFGQRRRKGPLRLWLRALSLERYSPRRERRRDERFRALLERRDDLDPRQAPIGMLSVPREAALRVDGFPEQAPLWGMDYEFQTRLKEIAGLRFVFEPLAYGLHGPLPGDSTNASYRRPLAQWPDAPRRGLSAYAGEDPGRFEIGARGRAAAGGRG